MLNALPNHAGTHRGPNVPMRPSSRNIVNSGTMITGNGTIMVANINMKSGLLPDHRTRAKAYATIALETTVPLTAKMATNNVLRR